MLLLPSTTYLFRHLLMHFNIFKMRPVLTQDVSKTTQNTKINLKFVSERKVTTLKPVLKLSSNFEATFTSGVQWWYRWSCYIPSDVSVCGEYPSDKLKVPLSVQDTSETSVSDTDSSLATTAGLTYTENSPTHGIIIFFKKSHCRKPMLRDWKKPLLYVIAT